MDAPEQKALRIISEPVVCDKTGSSRTTIWRLLRAGDFPEPVQISPNRKGWIEHEVDAWIMKRMALRPSRAHEVGGERAGNAERDAPDHSQVGREHLGRKDSGETKTSGNSSDGADPPGSG